VIWGNSDDEQHDGGHLIGWFDVGGVGFAFPGGRILGDDGQEASSR
jgi:hypothetical protein